MKQLLLPLDLPPQFIEADFIVSPSNKEAYLWIHKWPEWPRSCLALYGEKACGKTHISHIWQNKAQARRLTETEFDDIPLDELLKTSPLYVIENADKIKDEEKLFHLYNHILNSQGGLLLLSRTPPARWEISLPDLRSRLNSIPGIPINPPDDELLEQVFQKRFKDLQVTVDPTVISFLLKHMERSFASASTWAEKLNALSIAQKRPITIPLVRELLKE